MLRAKDRLIVALDVDTMEEAQRLVEMLSDHVGMFKVGMQLYNSAGPEVVRMIQRQRGKVFVDLKFHDIPNTVAHAGAVVTRLGADIFNVHAAGGSEMMRKTAEATRQEVAETGLPKPLVLAVTVLTSIDQATLNEEIGIPGDMEAQVVKWAKLAKECGLDGVVASPREVRAIRKACGADFALVIPGIRPAWAAANDQKRIMTPKEAICAGATYLVVGRPITASNDPVCAAQRVVKEIEEGLAC